MSNSGIVLAGFGDKDFFPKLASYRAYGVVLGKFIYEEEKGKAASINQSNASLLLSFAQDEMIRTFTFGLGAGTLVEINKQFVRASDELYDSLVASGLAPDLSGDPAKLAELEKLKTQAKDDFGDRILDYCGDAHARPMRRVLGALPFDELAQLAETLVLLESLKERVTSPSASVSGPIDVAVISKNDGFIWVKRKHYFDPELNPRYFSKYRTTGGSQS